jgi:sterol desaturase/sphingolipid hydroxylase (fatty acid hydroxylase superfamily)
VELFPNIPDLITTAVIHLLRLLPAVILLSVLESIFSKHKRSWRSAGVKTDLGFLLLSLLYAPLLRHFGTLLAVAFFASSPDIKLQGSFSTSHLPLFLQILLVLLIRDICIYIRHRLFHGRTLWKFHAVHHSSEEVTWLSTLRFHPGEALIEVSINLALFALLAPSHEATVIIALILGFYDYFLHADLRISYGPLNYLLVSPLYHRWHHSTDPEARNKNFAAMFSFIDLALGTFYFPQHKSPEQTGILSKDARVKVPDTFWGQLWYPFR